MKSIALLLAPALALAGCLASPQAQDGAEPLAPSTGTELASPVLRPLPPGVPGELGYAGCTEQGGVFGVPPGVLPEPPEGFASVSFDPAGQLLVASVVTWACTDDAGVQVVERVGGLAVVPPEGYRADDVDFYVVVAGLFTSDERHAATFRAWGLFDHDPTAVELEVLQDTPAARAGHTRAEEEGFVLHHYSVVEGPEAPEPAGKLRMFGVAEGRVTAVVDIAWSEATSRSQGESLLTFEGGGPAPAYAGMAFHIYGEGYGWNMTLQPLGLDDPGRAAEPEPLRWLERRLGGLPAAGPAPPALPRGLAR